DHAVHVLARDRDRGRERQRAAQRDRRAGARTPARLVGAAEPGPVNFDLSDEQRLLQDTIRGFLAKECPPAHLRSVFGGEGHDPSLWKGMIELGLGGLHLAEAYGGAGLELVDLSLAAETLGHGGAPGPFLGHALAGLAIQLAGSREQRETWLPRLAGGEA